MRLVNLNNAYRMSEICRNCACEQRFGIVKVRRNDCNMNS